MNKLTFAVFSFICLCSLFFIQNLFAAEKIQWNIPENERLEMMRTAHVNLYINRKLARTYEERNIIDLTCISKTDNKSNVKGVFSVFDRASGQNIFNLREQYLVNFDITSNGRFTVNENYYMPNLRHVPSFPDKELNINDQWSMDGELIIANYSRPFKLIFPVHYTLTEVSETAGSRIATIKYSYTIDKDMRNQNLPADFPLRIAAQNSGIIKWNLSKNRPIAYNDAYYILFVHPDGERGIGTAEYSMNIQTENTQYAVVTEAEKLKASKDIAQELPKDKGIDVNFDDRGIVISLGDMLFDFDSYNLRADTKQTLDNVIDIVKQRYKDREIIVEGHTDNTGNAQYNQNLSEQRAKTVAGFLKQGIGHDKFSYRGLGAKKPVADNTTKEGRQKNRRVEVIIKLN